MARWAWSWGSGRRVDAVLGADRLERLPGHGVQRHLPGVRELGGATLSPLARVDDLFHALDPLARLDPAQQFVHPAGELLARHERLRVERQEEVALLAVHHAGVLAELGAGQDARQHFYHQ